MFQGRLLFTRILKKDGKVLPLAKSSKVLITILSFAGDDTLKSTREGISIVPEIDEVAKFPDVCPKAYIGSNIVIKALKFMTV